MSAIVSSSLSTTDHSAACLPYPLSTVSRLFVWAHLPVAHAVAAWVRPCVNGVRYSHADLEREAVAELRETAIRFRATPGVSASLFAGHAVREIKEHLFAWSCIPLALSLARRHRRLAPAGDADEFTGEAYVALARAARKFSPDYRDARGQPVQFTTYATTAIVRHLTDYAIREQQRRHVHGIPASGIGANGGTGHAGGSGDADHSASGGGGATDFLDSLPDPRAADPSAQFVACESADGKRTAVEAVHDWLVNERSVTPRAWRAAQMLYGAGLPAAEVARRLGGELTPGRVEVLAAEVAALVRLRTGGGDEETAREQSLFDGM